MEIKCNLFLQDCSSSGFAVLPSGSQDFVYICLGIHTAPFTHWQCWEGCYGVQVTCILIECFKDC